MKRIFVDFTRLSYFRAVRDAASWWWNWNAPTTLHYLDVSGRLMLHITNFQFWNVGLSGAQIGSCILFVGIISIFLKVLNILILLYHIYLALVYHRNTSFRLDSYFVLQLALKLHRFGFQFAQLWASILRRSLMARFLCNIDDLLLHQIRLFIFIFKYF